MLLNNRPDDLPTMGAVGARWEAVRLGGSGICRYGIMCLSRDLLEVTASCEMTQQYSAYVSFSGSLPSL